MTYGIYVTKEIFDIFEDGSKKKVSTSQGWYTDACYDSMKSAKEGLSKAKGTLNEDFFDVAQILKAQDLQSIYHALAHNKA